MAVNLVRPSFLILGVLVIQIWPRLPAADLPTSPGVGFPMVGVGSGQTMRINMLNNGSGGEPLSSGRVPGGCGGGISVEFYSGEGELLKKKVIPNLLPGKAAFVDLSHDELPKGTGRTQIRAVLRYGYAGGAPPSPEMVQLLRCNLLPSLEIWENTTGKTSLLVMESKPLPEPNPPRR